ncbi:MAG TPA: hypothetical protein VFY05_00800 [Candidatus Angelobacter sp.]|nr:hypothetical protein [Candidatus Angelobacter sp.]
MSRLAVFSVFLLFVLQMQAQTFGQGIPAGANSPEPNGREHGIPSSVLSPRPIPPGVNVPGVNVPSQRRFFFNGPLHRFGNPHSRSKVIVPVPIFFPIYGYGDAGYPADPSVPPSAAQPGDSSGANSAESSPEEAQPTASDEMLRQAYLQGARDALKDTLQEQRGNSRYGEHYLDSREQQRSHASGPSQDNSQERSEEAAAPAPAIKEDSGPATVFIFKDGHQMETRNYAIMGDTLYDFSGSILKKVQLSELDKNKTVQANEDRGITVKLP